MGSQLGVPTSVAWRQSSAPCVTGSFDTRQRANRTDESTGAVVTPPFRRVKSADPSDASVRTIGSGCTTSPLELSTPIHEPTIVEGWSVFDVEHAIATIAVTDTRS
jgi:hypothetical protein